MQQFNCLDLVPILSYCITMMDSEQRVEGFFDNCLLNTIVQQSLILDGLKKRFCLFEEKRRDFVGTEPGVEI